MTHFKKTLLLAGVLGVCAPTFAPQGVRAEAKADDGVKSNVSIPLDGATVVSGGQTFTLSGSLHGTFSAKRQKDGVFLKTHLNAQGISLTAADGTVYRGVGAVNVQVRADADGATFKGVANIGLIGKGPAPNFRLHVNVRGSVDANGNVTVSRDTIELR